MICVNILREIRSKIISQKSASYLLQDIIDVDKFGTIL